MSANVSASCDVGAHERCPGCACGCHVTDSAPASGGAGVVHTPGAGPARQAVGAGSPTDSWPGNPNHVPHVRPGQETLGHLRPDHRVRIQVLSAAIPGVIAFGLLTWCIVLGSQGLL